MILDQKRGFDPDQFNESPQGQARLSTRLSNGIAGAIQEEASKYMVGVKISEAKKYPRPLSALAQCYNPAPPLLSHDVLQ